MKAVFPTLVTLMTVVSSVLVATMGTSSSARPPTNPLTLISTAQGSLVWHPEPPATLKALPSVGVDAVLADHDHAMRPCPAAEHNALPISPAATASWCWDAGDTETRAWMPQGVTTSDGVGRNRVVLSGWHSTLKNRYDEARVAFVDFNNPKAPVYRWVYLVVPNSTGTNYSAANTHVGGLAWYGDRLFVTAADNTSTAIRVFSMSRILKTNDTSQKIGKTHTGYAAYGYKYVMPQIGYYAYAGGTCDTGSDTGVPCFSSLSLDRSTSPPSLVTSEYFDHAALRGRLHRYGLGPDHLLTEHGGKVTAEQAYRSDVDDVQGVLSWHGRWWVAHSSAVQPGQLWSQSPTRSTPTTCGSSDNCWAFHPEALTYDDSTRLLWSQTEWPQSYCTPRGQTCGRTLFDLPLTP